MHFFFLKKDNYILHSKKNSFIFFGKYKVKLYKPNSYMFTIDSLLFFIHVYTFYTCFIDVKNYETIFARVRMRYT